MRNTYSQLIRRACLSVMAGGHQAVRRSHFVCGLLLLLGTGQLFATNHYVLAGATGANSGTDWTNAYTAVPATMIRGDTYYVGVGTYAAHKYNTAASGTTVITIKKATVADHGTTIGWNDAFAGQASFGPYNPFDTSYWVFDGQVGSGTDASTYGFIITPPATGDENAIFLAESAVTITSVNISHVAFKGPTADVSKSAIVCFTQIVAWSNSTVSYCLFDGMQGAIQGNGTGGGNSGIVFEHNICLNGASTAAHHGEQIDTNAAPFVNLVVRYNTFINCTGTGVVVANNNNINGAAVYGNVFANCNTGNGIVTGTSIGVLNNVLVYNNTFSKNTGGVWFNDGTGGSGGIPSGNVVQNNLVFGMSANITGTPSIDYNAYYQCTSAPAETHGATSAINPFVNSASNDYRITAVTTAGLTLASPYNLDPLGTTRGAGGVWSRGAYEFAAATPPAGQAISTVIR
jgi:hypothetical protein